MEKYLDQSLSARERAEDLLSKMSLEEKMGQVRCLFPFGKGEEVEKAVEHGMRYGIGEVSTLDVREITSLDEAARWQRELQTRIMEHSAHHIPATFHMEGLCGAFIQDALSLPAGISRASGWDPELEEKLGNAVGRQELACGITQVLAPVLDISRDSRMGRQGETYGEDPTLAAALGSAFTKGIQGQETAGRKAESVAKHFLGFHNSYGGIHGANSEISPRLLREVYAKPFQAAITEQKLRGIMPCYCSMNGEPVSSSREILTDLLRGEMGFDGVCTADYSAVSNVHAVQHVAESLPEAGLMCMEAGMDVEMQMEVAYSDELMEWFRTGKADIRILDQAVLRVLEAKFRMGLFEHPFALDGEELKAQFYDENDAALTLQSARESLILLKNNGALPIRKDVKRIAVIGNHAAKARSFFGGYTHLSMVEAVHAAANSIAGLESGSVSGKNVKLVPGTQIQSDEGEQFEAVLRQQKPQCRSLLEQMKEALPDVRIDWAYGYAIAGDDLSQIPEALEICKDADLIVMTLGGKHGSCSVASMGEGVDAADINLPVCQDTFILEASKLGIPMVGVHLDGRPISSDIADQYLDAILEAWSPAECGAQAVVEALTGAYNPGGKLPLSVARNAGQIPIYYNHPYGSAWHQGESIGFVNYVDLPHTPRYFFGHGLSYTTFGYSDLKVLTKEADPDGQIRLEVTVENTGDCAGDEVVQLYVHDLYASVTRPVKELAGFARIHLAPGEKKKVTFFLEASQLAFLDRKLNWKVEKGEMEVQVGSSSEDIRLKDSFFIREDALVEGKNRGFYAKAKVEHVE